MRKVSYFFAVFSLLLAQNLSSVSYASGGIHVGFVMVDQTTGKNVGSGTTILLNQVNRNENQHQTTNSEGFVSFDIAPLDYVLTSYCMSCHSDYQSNAGTQYLISPQEDGSVKVLSASDEPVARDALGNFVISFVANRRILGSDPWQLMKDLPNFGGSPEHMYLMTNGTVLMQSRDGKGFEKWWILKPDQNGSYLTGTWSQAAQPPAGYNPQNMNGAVLHSGNFMIVGGEQNTNSAGVMEDDTNQSYIYNPSTNTWSSVAPPNGGVGDWAGIGAAPFVVLANGQVMVGHNGTNNKAGLSAMLYDEVKSTWTITGENKPTSNNEEGYTLLPNDKVLSIWNGDDNPNMLGTNEIYDPASGLWTPAPRVPVALGHSEIGPAVALPNGKVLATGATGHNALYDPESNSWSTVPDFPKLANGLQEGAPDDEAVVLPNGNVLVITSVFTCSTQNCTFMGPAAWYEYKIDSNTWEKITDDPIVPSSSNIANGTQVLMLPNGQVMVTGEGRIAFYTSSGVANPSWAPQVKSLSSSALSPGATYTVGGERLAGLTQGSFWGDEQQNATNYGLVQITNLKTHHVSYARAFNYSSTSISRSANSTFDFEIDPKMENGPSQLRVIANGIASQPVDVTISGAFDKAAADKAAADKAAADKAAADKAAADKAAADKAAADKAAADKAAADKAAADKATVKKLTITCVKGKLTKTVTAVKPACPVGYKRK